MLLIQEQKSEIEPNHDRYGESAGDLPPAYDALSIHRATGRGANQPASLSAFPEPVAGSSSGPFCSNPTNLQPPVLLVDKSLPPPPSSPHDTTSSPKNARPTTLPKPRALKNSSWLSLLPFASSFSAKRARQSVLSTVSDLVVPPSRISSEEQKSAHEILSSVAETCAEHKLTLSSILQETFVADHTPMYWAVVNYRRELLVALLVHSRPLSVQAISDIRRACLVSSNQALFHALRVCRPPFHGTDGIRVQSLRTASENLLLDNRPLDKIHILRTSDQGYVVSFDISLWQRRMKVIGQASIEFIASGRMWSVTFFSTDPSSTSATSGKSRQGVLHVMISLLESSPPTFFDSQLVVEVPPPVVPDPVLTPRLREVRSTTFPPSRDVQQQSRSLMYEHNHDRKIHSRLSPRNVPVRSETNKHPSSSLSKPPPPTHPMKGSLFIRLGCGNRKLARRARSAEPSELAEKPTMKPDTWSDHGVGYTNAVVAPLGGPSSQLLYEHSRYLFPDGTLRGRLEARFVKSESSKDCIVC